MTTTFDANDVNAMHRGTFAGEIGIVTHSVSRDGVTATVELRSNHRQPMGIVHGGVYTTIVETLASIGAAADALTHGKSVVGLENHTSFVRATREGTLHADATPITRGRRVQLWDVTIRNDDAAIVATGRVRLLVVEPDSIT